MVESAVLKQRAKNALSGHWGSAVLVSFAASLLGGNGGGGGSVSTEIDGETLSVLVQEYPWLQDAIDAVVAVLPFIVIYGLVITVIGGMIQLGYYQYCVKLCLGVDAGVKELFVHKQYLLKAFALSLLIAIKTALWYCLFVIPGIVASYRYAMAPYLMAENPDMGIVEAIEESKAMMNGYKGDLFWLHLSFLGWALLSVFTLGIGNLWLNPYMRVTEAEFYLELTGRGQSAETLTGYRS